MTTNNGSTFTRLLFGGINRRERSVPNLLRELRRGIPNQTVTVHSSYPDIKILWGWIFGLNDLNITVDRHNSIISIER